MNEKNVSATSIMRFFWIPVFLTALFNTLAVPIAIDMGSEFLGATWEIVVVVYVVVIVVGMMLPRKDIPARIIMLPVGVICIISLAIQLIAHQTVLINGLGYETFSVAAFSIVCIFASTTIIWKWFLNRIMNNASNRQHPKRSNALVISVTIPLILVGRVILDNLLQGVGGDAKIIATAYAYLWFACVASWGFPGVYYSVKFYRESPKVRLKD